MRQAKYGGGKFADGWNGSDPYLVIRANTERTRVTYVTAATDNMRFHRTREKHTEIRAQFPTGNGAVQSVILEKFVDGRLRQREVAGAIEPESPAAELLGELTDLTDAALFAEASYDRPDIPAAVV